MKSLTLLAVLMLVVVACGGTTETPTTDGEVRPFSEIQANDFVFEADELNPGRAIFRVTTTEPAICAIVWGETESLGNFNNSLAMNGTGIVDHDVFLPGAEPGETYFFKVQGSTADGSLFASELATFTVPELVDSPPPTATATNRGRNLALDATVVGVSSEFGPDWAAVNAIDGSLDTEWSTAGDGSDAHLTLDLGSPQQIAGVEFITRSMADGTAITTTYWVTVDDGEPLGPFPAGAPADTRFQALDVPGQVVRFETDVTTGGNTGAIEIRVFAPAP